MIIDIPNVFYQSRRDVMSLHEIISSLRDCRLPNTSYKLPCQFILISPLSTATPSLMT